MDRDVLKLTAHIDQTRADVRAALAQMESGERVELFRACATGRLTGMDEPTTLLVGILASLAIYDIRCGERADADE
jgi:hypothetical protein